MWLLCFETFLMHHAFSFLKHGFEWMLLTMKRGGQK